MKIDQTQIIMNSQSIQKVEREDSTQMQFRAGDRPQFELPAEPAENSDERQYGFSGIALDRNDGLALGHDQVELSEAGRQLAANLDIQADHAVASDDEVVFELSCEDKVKIKLIQDFLEKLTGKRVELRLPRSFILNREAEGLAGKLSEIYHLEKNGAQARSVQASNMPVAAWSLAVNVQQTIRETENFNFTSSGIVRTADGREMSFAINLQASRETVRESSFSLLAGNAAVKDPLVISLDGKLPELSQDKMLFDLDYDGTPDQISRLLSGSGYLALDRDGDSRIGDGRELFGAVSGDGFAELAAWDSDQNGWIDEQDPVFNQLRIWQVADDGGNRLLALGEAGIGAVYLGHITGSYDLKDENGSLLGRLQSSGLFLKENGEAGTIHHLDLVI